MLKLKIWVVLWLRCRCRVGISFCKNRTKSARPVRWYPVRSVSNSLCPRKMKRRGSRLLTYALKPAQLVLSGRGLYSVGSPARLLGSSAELIVSISVIQLTFNCHLLYSIAPRRVEELQHLEET